MQQEELLWSPLLCLTSMKEVAGRWHAPGVLQCVSPVAQLKLPLAARDCTSSAVQRRWCVSLGFPEVCGFNVFSIVCYNIS